MKMDDNKKLFLSVEYHWKGDNSPHSPYPPIDNYITIEKNEINGKFHLTEEGIEDSPWFKEKEYDNFEEAFDYLYNHQEFSFSAFQIEYIKSELIFFYTKKLLEQLNANYSNDYDWLRVENYKNELPLYSFKEKLGINLKVVKNASKKGLQVIKITKNGYTSFEEKKFLIGKLSVDGGVIKVGDETGNIVYLTTAEKVSVETESIDNKYYWYFEK